MLMVSCTEFQLHEEPKNCTLPWAKAPTTKTIGSLLGTMSRTSLTSAMEKEVPIFIQPTGKWSDTGFLIT